MKLDFFFSQIAVIFDCARLSPRSTFTSQWRFRPGGGGGLEYKKGGDARREV